MHADIASNLHFHYMPSTGTIQMWWQGRHVKRYDISAGSRQFFKVGAYFIKAEYAHSHTRTQCHSEVFVYGKLEQRDQQFFPKLLACSSMGAEEVQWVMYPWYNLKPVTSELSVLYKYCQAKVQRLCDKYGIRDVAPYVNINWFIHKGKPLIVDCGCAGDSW